MDNSTITSFFSTSSITVFTLSGVTPCAAATAFFSSSFNITVSQQDIRYVLSSSPIKNAYPVLITSFAPLSAQYIRGSCRCSRRRSFQHLRRPHIPLKQHADQNYTNKCENRPSSSICTMLFVMCHLCSPCFISSSFSSNSSFVSDASELSFVICSSNITSPVD